MRRNLVLNMLFAVMLALAGSVALAAPAANGSVDVRNLITVSQFSATGLNTLSAAQLQTFNAWLGQFLNSPAAAAAANGNSTPDVRNYMSVNAYDQSGLASLSPAQLGALNAWFGQYLRTNPQASAASAAAPLPAAAPAVAAPVVAPPAPQPAAASGAGGFGMDSMAPEQNTEEPKRIESRIVGEFDGWNGNTVFKLENGQVWQQAATGYFTNVRLDNPPVVIKKLLFGYLLTLPGQGETVFVRRIK